MSIFVKSTPPPAIKTKTTGTISRFLAAILVLIAIGQMLNYEGFVARLVAYGLPLGIVGISVLAGFLVFAELLSVPFLVRLRLSPAMRFVSFVCGWLVLGLWLLLELWLNIHTAPGGSATARSTSLFGALITPATGWWSVSFIAALIVLAAWATWGMWPFPLRRK